MLHLGDVDLVAQALASLEGAALLALGVLGRGGDGRRSSAKVLLDHLSVDAAPPVVVPASPPQLPRHVSTPQQGMLCNAGDTPLIVGDSHVVAKDQFLPARESRDGAGVDPFADSAGAFAVGTSRLRRVVTP